MCLRVYIIEKYQPTFRSLLKTLALLSFLTLHWVLSVQQVTLILCVSILNKTRYYVKFIYLWLSSL